MRYRVNEKQPNSSMCLVCGLDNGAGLRASFYEIENGEVVAIFRPREEHQGYPGRLHGGLAAAVLDETIGRASMVTDKKSIWSVSVELVTRFKQPVPLEDEIRVVARITRDSNRLYEGTGEILLPDGSVAVEGRGKYLKMPLGKISSPDLEGQWKTVSSPADPRDIDR